jgi:hypothetical protein
MFNKLIPAALCAACALVCALPAEALKFDASLAPIKVDANPGQVASRNFRLTLAKDEQRTQFKVHVEDWWRSEDGKESFYKPAGTIPQSCAPWIKLNPVEAAVGPGETLDVRLSISIPKEAAPGGYWCAFTVDEVLDPLKVNPEGVGVRFLASLSIGVFVNVGRVNRSAKVVDVKMGEEAYVKVRNDGNCPLRIEGRFEFVPIGQSKPVARVDFPQTTALYAPVNITTIRVNLPDSKILPSGKYLVRAIIDIGLDHYLGVQKEMVITREPSTAPASIGQK